MKKLLVFIFALCCSKMAMADGGIPLLVFLGSNLFITGNFIFPFCYGLLLFILVVLLERWYLKKKLNIKEKILRPVVIANIYSTLWGIPLTIGLGFLLNYLCEFIVPYLDCFRPEECGLVCILVGPVAFLPIKNRILMDIAMFGQFSVVLFLFGWLSWFVEYRYLKKRLNHQKLKRAVALANLYSYIGMAILAVFITHLL